MAISHSFSWLYLFIDHHKKCSRYILYDVQIIFLLCVVLSQTVVTVEQESRRIRLFVLRRTLQLREDDSALDGVVTRALRCMCHNCTLSSSSPSLPLSLHSFLFLARPAQSDCNQQICVIPLIWAQAQNPADLRGSTQQKPNAFLPPENVFSALCCCVSVVKDKHCGYQMS